MSFDYTNHIDWDGDGDFDGTGEDVTVRTILRSALTTQHGRDQARALSPMAAGEMDFELNNISRDYSPENTSSPLNGLLLAGREVLFGGVPSMPALPRDTFTRSVSSGLGTADSGNVWTVEGTASDYSVNGTAAQLSVGSVNASRRALITTGEGDFDLTATFSVPVTPTGAPIRVAIVGRWTSLADHVAFWAEIQTTTNELRPVISVVVANVELFAAANHNYGLTHVPGDSYTIRARAEDDRLRIKIWRTDGTEPAEWAAEYVDGRNTTGQVGLRARLDSGNTNTLPVVVTLDNLATRLTLFHGALDKYEVLPTLEDRSVKLRAADSLGRLRGQKITTDLHQSIRTGAAVHAVLDAAGWPTHLRDIDVGATIIRWWWEDDADAFNALEKLVDSEGPPALLTTGPAGEVVFRDRHHRLLRQSSKTSQATLRDTGTEPVLTAPLHYDHGARDVVNSVTFAVEERDPAPEIETVWSSPQLVSIANGQTLLLRVQASDPFVNAVTPVAGTDYQLRSGTVTVSLSRTQGSSVTIFLKATGGTAQIEALQLRAQPLRVQRTIQVHAEDPVSIGTAEAPRYGRRPYGRTAPWAGVHDAAAIAAIILAHRAERKPVVRATLVSANDTRLRHMLARRISHRVTIVDAESGLNRDFFIERIERTLSEGLFFETVFGCEAAPAQTADIFILGSATRGVLGTNRLAISGLDDSSTLFILGSATQGLLGTNLLGH